MSEHTPPPEIRTARRLLGVGAVIALATVATVRYAPRIIEEIRTEPSKIVAGVPSQVETHRSLIESGNGNKEFHWLGIEQCPADIEAAQRGETLRSYDPKLGSIDPACNFDLVRVTAALHDKVIRGNDIIFPGRIGEPLKK